MPPSTSHARRRPDAQGRLWPLQIVRTEPQPFQANDCRLIGVGDDDQVYFVKRQCDGPMIPASEYLCSMMAQAIGLPVPVFHIAQMPDRAELCFASREEGGVVEGYAKLTELVRTSGLHAYAHQLAQWYAFDLFTQNIDRHPNNFLFRQSVLGCTMIGMDFSRALLASGWPRTVPPMAIDERTRKTARYFDRRAPYPAPSAVTLLHRLAAIPDDWALSCIETLPAPWLTDTIRASVARWWRIHRAKRIRLLRSHLGNGRYL